MTKLCILKYFIDLFASSKNQFVINFLYIYYKYTFIYFCNKILTYFAKSGIGLTSRTSKVLKCSTER